MRARRAAAGRRRQRLIASCCCCPSCSACSARRPRTPVVRGDELTDAKAKQAQLKKEVAEQKAQVTELNALQRGLAAEIADDAQAAQPASTPT